MKLRFFWCPGYEDRALPWCESSYVDKAGFSLIETYLLGEDGFGAKAVDSVITILDGVVSGELDRQRLHGDNVEAEFESDVVTIKIDIDGPTWRERWNPEEFRRVLVGWRDFMLAGPEGSPEVHMEVTAL